MWPRWEITARRGSSPFLFTSPSVEKASAVVKIYEESFGDSAWRTARALARLRVRPHIARCSILAGLFRMSLRSTPPAPRTPPPPPPPGRVMTCSPSVTRPLSVCCRKQAARQRRQQMAAVARDAHPAATVTEVASPLVCTLQRPRADTA